jgi:hypothetical protein
LGNTTADAPRAAVAKLESLKRIVIPKCGFIERGMCGLAAGRKNRFLAHKPGFGITRVEGLVLKTTVNSETL